MLIVLSDDLHKSLKKVASEKEITLKKATDEAIKEYIEKNNSKRSLV